MKNIIMRPVWNRPEMLKLSLDYEILAREYCELSSELHTIFLLEYGTTKEVLDVVSAYPYSHEVIKRPFQYGLTPNILEGYKVAFNGADSFVITIEDDILLHKTYFQYIDAVLSMSNLPKFSVINATGPNNGNVSEMRQTCHYGPWAPLVDKDFFVTKILPHANDGYYNNRSAKMLELNTNYMQHDLYIFNDSRWNEQAGLIHRLARISAIDDHVFILSPRQNRERNIGYFGKNRPGGVIPGKTLQDRFQNLTEIIKDPKSMVKHAGSNAHEKDYDLFNEDLDVWDGTLDLILRDS